MQKNDRNSLSSMVFRLIKEATMKQFCFRNFRSFKLQHGFRFKSASCALYCRTYIPLVCMDAKTWLNCSQLRKLFSKNKQTNFLGRALKTRELTSRSTKRLGYPILLTLSPKTLKIYQYLSFHQNLCLLLLKKPCFCSRLDQDLVAWLFKCHIGSVQW